MGRDVGRGAALSPALAETLARIAEAMVAADKPWWVIGSAAVVLHGGATEARDIDVLLSVRDAEVIAGRLGMTAARGSKHPLFRSERFFTWREPPLAVEFMAGFAVWSDVGWWPVAPVSRERVPMGTAAVFVPARDELRAMLLRFGRPKDLVRAALFDDRSSCPCSCAGRNPEPRS